MRVVNTDTLFHHNKYQDKCLQMAKKENNKKKYLDSRLHQHHHLSPFIVLVDGLLGVEAEATLK